MWRHQQTAAHGQSYDQRFNQFWAQKTVFSGSDARQGLIDLTARLRENNYENGFVNFP